MKARSGWILLALAWYVAVDWWSWATHFEGSLSVYYLIPVVVVTWYGSWWAGILLGLCCASPWWSVRPGSTFDEYAQILAYWNSIMEAGLYVAISLLVSSLKRALDRERALARTDPLTGVWNARAFRDLAGREADRARRSGLPLTLVCLDMDRFKEVNDRHGHAAGDELLKSVVALLKAQVRTTDLVARLGGDEFVLLLPESGREAALLPLERIRGTLQAQMQAKGLPVSLSIGAMTFASPPPSVDEMLAQADARLYEAKRAGRDRIIQAEAG